jgi:vancomycin permeability regulator SanA
MKRKQQNTSEFSAVKTFITHFFNRVRTFFAAKPLKTLKKQYRIIFTVSLSAIALGLATLLILNGIVVGKTKAQIREITSEDGYETALVLGAKVHVGGRLSDMLRDRMDVGIRLYHEGAVKKLLVSGDGSGEWSETEHMKRYAMEKGVADEDILTDGEGFSTYESVCRAKEIYHLDKFVIVTQKYHLHRAIYIAESMDIEALGADAALYTYAGQLYRDIREVLARIKDMAVCLFDSK